MKIASSHLTARYAEKKERNPRVAVFDGFASKGEEPQHGDKVEEIIRRSTGLGDQFVQNFQNSYDTETSFDDVAKAPVNNFRKRLRSYTIEVITGFLGATRHNLETILADDKSKVRVINQSQSQCSARISRPFIKEILDDEDFRLKVKESYGLPSGAHKDTVAGALLNDVQHVMDTSRYIATARKEYKETAKKAFDRGIAHVVTSGNLGRLTAQYEMLGIKAPKDAYKSVLADQYSTIIGATASQGTTSTRDDKAASFTSVYADAEFAMHGVNVEVIEGDNQTQFSNGTSFAAPQATALIHDIFKTNPKLGVDQMEDILYKSTIPVHGTKEQVGAGQIDPMRAMYLAEQSKFAGSKK